MDFFLSGRSLPAWVTGLAFISANLGAVEIMGMSANGAEFGLPTVHYFWVGAIPAMLFLGVVMMPFYYGSKVRSVPEFMLPPVRHGRPPGQRDLVRGRPAADRGHQPLPARQHHARAARLAALGRADRRGRDRAVLHHPRRPERRDLQRGAAVLRDRRLAAAADPDRAAPRRRLGRAHRQDHRRPPTAGHGRARPSSSSTPGPARRCPASTPTFWSVVGIVFGLGFVLSFGYWTTNFVEVQRAMASDSISSARKTPIIGAFPKMFVPFITIIPGMIAAVLVTEIAKLKAGETVAGRGVRRRRGVQRLPALPDARRAAQRPAGAGDHRPAGGVHGRHGGQHLGVQHGASATTSGGDYIVKDRADDYYLRVGRIATVAATVIAIFTAALASNFSNIMDYLQMLFGFFNAPLFATFILGMFWKRMTPTAGWVGLVVRHPVGGRDRRSSPRTPSGRSSTGRDPARRAGRGVPGGLGGVRRRHRAEHRGLAGHRAQAGRGAARPGLLRDAPRGPASDADEASYPWYRRTLPLAGISLVMVIVLNVVF